MSVWSLCSCSVFVFFLVFVSSITQPPKFCILLCMQCFLRVTDDCVSTSHRCNISVRDEARCHPQVISVTPPIFLPFSRKITSAGYLCFFLFSHQIFPPMAVCHHYWSISLRRSSVPIKALTIPIQQDCPNCTRGGHVVRFPDLLGTFMASGNLTRGSWLPNQMFSLILIFGWLCRSSIFPNPGDREI